MTHEAYVWVSIVGLGGMTLVTRCALLMWPRPVQLPMRLQRTLRFAPMAAIAGIVVPGVFFHQGVGGVELDPRTLAAAAVILAWWMSRHMGTAMLSGLAIYVVAKLAVMHLL